MRSMWSVSRLGQEPQEPAGVISTVSDTGGRCHSQECQRPSSASRQWTGIEDLKVMMVEEVMKKEMMAMMHPHASAGGHEKDAELEMHEREYP